MTWRRPRTCCILLVALLLIVATGSLADGELNQLREEFQNPPEAAWPRTWWHWTKGSVTKSGITADLEWMRRVGIVGFQLADVNFGGGQTIAPAVDFGSPEWLDAVRHAAAEADRLDLEMAIFSSPGWSMTGGPWVEPRQAMKKLVWSETEIEGPRQFDAQLPAPPSNNGIFQDMGAGRGNDPMFYRDVRVLAFRTPEVEADAEAALPRVTCSAGAIDAAALRDGSYAKAISIAAPADGGPAWIEYAYETPQTVRAVTIAGDAGIPVGRIAASDDGRAFRTLVTLPGAQLYRQGRVRTFAVPETMARVFRLELEGAPLRPDATMSETRPVPAKQYSLLEWKLHPGARVHRWEEKAAFGHLFEYESVAGADVAASTVIPSCDVLDISTQMSTDGTLRWIVPPGRWTVIRLGYSLTGAKNRPAVPAGHGLEVDKLSREHTAAYYDAYTKPIAAALGELYGRSLRYMLIDSWEAGQQNWTDDMIGEFTRRRGYDPTPYLPALVGRVVESADASERFLWDFRRTLADMFAENHYAVMSELAHRDGLGVYSEASGVSLEIPEDTLMNKSKVDIPMGEFWMFDLHPRLMYLQDVRGAASAAHAYGKPIVAAEAFTGGGYESPLSLKRASDYWLAQGINRLVYHTSAHQPLDTKPGNVMVGTHMHRNITWAEQAESLNRYFARTCFLLQQGKPVKDIAYLLNEGAPSTMPIWGAGTTPAPPPGYDHDFIHANVLLHRLSVSGGGELALPDGMRYRVLVLPDSRRMRPELVAKLLELVRGGATIIGPRPLASPSFHSGDAANRQVTELAESLWGDLNGTSRTIRHVGQGLIVWGRSIEDVLARIGVGPDFEWSGPLDAEVAWAHRRTEDADIYYVSNLSDREVFLEARFRVSGRKAELWKPDSGEIAPSSYSSAAGRTTVPLHMAPHETAFVVFTGRDEAGSVEVRQPKFVELGVCSGEWKIKFPAGLGAPEHVTTRELRPWGDHELTSVRYFAGTATYALDVTIPKDWITTGRRLALDLGDVRDVAEVVVNGTNLGVVWKPPFRVDATAALRQGQNRLEVLVTNQWTNRILGDRLAPVDERVLSGAELTFGRIPNEPDVSGLLGPVRILAVE